MLKRTSFYNLLTAVFLATVMITGAHAAKSYKAPQYQYELVANMSFEIDSIDTASKTIKIQGDKYGYTGRTKITDTNGNKLRASDLVEGMQVVIKYSDSQRYVKYPSLSEILVLSNE